MEAKDNALACRRCNMQAGAAQAKSWRRCEKCSFLWCPRCAPPDSDRCANCVGGTLKAV